MNKSPDEKQFRRNAAGTQAKKKKKKHTRREAGTILHTKIKAIPLVYHAENFSIGLQ